MRQAFIIGKDVSKGARSPILWNACFKEFKINAEMTPVDIEEMSELKTFLDTQIHNKNFLGAAVASPLKEQVASYFIENLDVNFYGPANCFFKADNNFEILNTDTLAALETIEQYFPNLKFIDIAILGSGAVAKSLAFNLRDHKATKSIYARSDKFSKIFESFNFICKPFEEINSNLIGHQIIVNCTDIGRDGASDESPINTNLFSENDFSNHFIFDVNYINGPSKLLQKCKEKNIDCADGSRMNLMQAAIAFARANKMSHEIDKILKVMEDSIK
jgi:shikimate dehydrogenase